jgi:hypothetical protein
MPEMKTLNGYEIVDAKAREDIKALKGGEDIDLSEYAKKTDIPDVSNFITEVPSEYVTETELNGKGYLTQHQSLAEYAKKSEIPDVSKYQTEAQVQALINTALGVIENGSY